MDGPHLFFDDPASWRQTLSWYDFKLAESDRALMVRRKTPRYGDAVPLASAIASWGHPVPVPDAGGIVVVNADVSPSLVGELRQTLYRGAAVYLDVQYRSGRHERFRTVPANLTDGFIIDPLPNNLGELSDLMRPLDNTADRVAWFSFVTQRPSDFEPAIRLCWSRLPLRGGDDADIKAADRSRL